MRGTFSRNPPPVMCAAAWSSPSRWSPSTIGAWIAHGSSSSSASDRPSSGTGSSSERPSSSARRTSEYPFACRPLDGSPISTSPSRTRVGPRRRALLDGAHAEPREVELIVGHHPRVLGGLAPHECAPRPPAAFRDPFHQLGDVLGHHPAHGDVVEEEQRLRAGAHDVVGTHRDQVDPHRGAAPGQPGDLELRADPVGRGREQPSTADREQAGEPTDARRPPRAGAPARRGRRSERRPSRPPRCRRPRRGRRRSPEAHAVGSWSWSSSTNLPTPSGTGIGYSPSKHARAERRRVPARRRDHPLDARGSRASRR